jgi:hypothetical protein
MALLSPRSNENWSGPVTCQRGVPPDRGGALAGLARRLPLTVPADTFRNDAQQRRLVRALCPEFSCRKPLARACPGHPCLEPTAISEGKTWVLAGLALGLKLTD